MWLGVLLLILMLGFPVLIERHMQNLEVPHVNSFDNGAKKQKKMMDMGFYGPKVHSGDRWSLRKD